jgi:hypothetical protein
MRDLWPAVTDLADPLNPRLVFATLADYLAWIDASPRRWSHVDSLAGRFGFAGTHTYEEARNLIAHGWTEGRQRIAQAITRAMQVQPPEPARVDGYDVGGAYPCVPLAVAGEPACMVSPTVDATAQRPIVDIWFAPGIRAGGTPDQYLRRGAAILAYSLTLEDAGYRVALTAAQVSSSGGGPERDSHSIACRVTVKAPDQPLDADRLAFVMMHASMHRRINFAAWERLSPTLERTQVSGYGATHPAPLSTIPEGVIYFPPVDVDHPERFNTQEGANARVRDALVAAGILPPAE